MNLKPCIPHMDYILVFRNSGPWCWSGGRVEIVDRREQPSCAVQPASFTVCRPAETKVAHLSDDVDPVRRCLTASFFVNATKLHYTSVYRTIHDDHVLHIHPTSFVV
ncbi:uncharacterized protein LOC121389526 [Gigantopelta aegis]|uniref:uncharacterized protein LOC121389526 n=1 Tax=Gigantopelta aegis TaxID=1735272 RepID=UPI001B889557|nr:uncharacterized protein LOC121389526 [Gigantopelta aegis]